MARLNGLDSDAYLAYVLERIADHPVNRVDEPLPWNVTPPLAYIRANTGSKRITPDNTGSHTSCRDSLTFDVESMMWRRSAEGLLVRR